ncbi:NAD(P)-binding protein [Hypoxylon sp. FL0543]|nr:NAD(P)-binding protein [Hypoxylon sp. FL0543]
MMSDPKRSVLITGCSDGGIGAFLAIAFHKAGLHVYATVRNPAKAEGLASTGIEVLTLDISSESSIAACVEKVPSLDILVNNAGQTYFMPVADLDIAEAKRLFDVNVWAQIAVTQAFLPLLIKSPSAIVVNHTSACSAVPLAFQATYNASKAALSMFSDNLRLEMDPFGVRVVELKSGFLRSNFVRNAQSSNAATLPKGSVYEPVRELVEKRLRSEGAEDMGELPDRWAEQVVRDLLKRNPPRVIWRGGGAGLSWLSTMLPYGVLDGALKKSAGLDEMKQIIQKGESSKPTG